VYDDERFARYSPFHIVTAHFTFSNVLHFIEAESKYQNVQYFINGEAVF